MNFNKLTVLMMSASALIVSGCSINQSESMDDMASNMYSASQACMVQATPEKTEFSVSGLMPVATYVSPSPFDTSAAEIVNYDECSDQLFVVNAQAKTVEVLKPTENSLDKLTQLDLSLAAKAQNIEIGAANSVATYNGLVAVAVENKVKQQIGLIALYDAFTYELITTFEAGALPDMVAFSPDGRYLAAANEGEPSGDYRVDPEGSITLIDLSKSDKAAAITQISFTDFNEGNSRHSELDDQVRISGLNASVAQDLEPEYLAFDQNGKLFVAMQENNAMAKIDVKQAAVEHIYPLGVKKWNNQQLDPSNKDKMVGNFQSFESLGGLYMPDSIATYQVDGMTYILSANEGDGREYLYETTEQQCTTNGHKWDDDICISHLDEVRGAKLDVDPNHVLADALSDSKVLGRLKFIDPMKKVEQGDELLSFGARSFSIWSDQGELVFDSGDQFAQIVYSFDSENLNSSNDSNSGADSRSDDKGVEPEAITVAEINNRHYAFIGLERQGGIMVYDVSTPSAPMFISYLNNRDFTQQVCTLVDDGDCANSQYNPDAGDLGPESIDYFHKNGMHFIAVGNEVSGTTTLYKLLF